MEASSILYKPPGLYISCIPNKTKMGSDDEKTKMSELKSFDDTKSGVKGVVESGITKIPSIFIHKKRSNIDDKPISSDADTKMPIIDLGGDRSKIISQVGNACEEWGFFQIINHGISPDFLNQVVDGLRRFHCQDLETKQLYYSRDYDSKKVLYNSNFDLYQAHAASWRDTLTFVMGPDFPPPNDMPPVCRDIMLSYKNEVLKLGAVLYELVAESLGLEDPNYFKNIGCADEIFVPCHYYPPCPEPELTMGLTTHADSGFLTLLLQDQVGGLQVFHRDHWFNVEYIPGALIVNLGDLMQLLTNDKYKSAYHRVQAVRGKEGRVSVACIFRTQNQEEGMVKVKSYGPIKELLSENNPPRYREITLGEAVAAKQSVQRNQDNTRSILPAFRI